MKAVIAYVKAALAISLDSNRCQFGQFQAGVALHQHAPLTIKAKSNDEELLSYQAAWDNSQATIAFGATDMYKAGGNVLWLNPFTEDAADEICAGAPPSWEQVYTHAGLFALDPARDSAVAPMHSSDGKLNSGGSEAKIAIKKDNRILFPHTFVVWSDSANEFLDLQNDGFPGSLKILTGHALLYGWHLEMFYALIAGDVERVALLWQAGLTVSLHARVLSTPAARAKASIDESNIYKTKSLSCDAFPAMARKVEVVLQPSSGSAADKLKVLVSQNVRFNGSIINKTMLQAATLLCAKADASTWDLFYELEQLQSGKDGISSKYQVLRNLLSMCSRADEKSKNSPGTAYFLNHILKFLIWHLQTGDAGQTVTGDWLCGASPGGKCESETVAKGDIVIIKVCLNDHLRSFVTDLNPHHPKRTEVETALRMFASYKDFGQAVALHGAAAQDGPDGCSSKYEELHKQSTTLAQGVLSFLHEIWTGDYDDDLAEGLAGQELPCPASLVCSTLTGDFGTKLKELTDKLGNHTYMVSLQAGMDVDVDGEPRGEKRPLENQTDEDSAESKHKAVKREVWKQVQTQRKKFAQVHVLDFSTAEDLKQFFGSGDRLKVSSELKAGSNHRIYTATAETCDFESTPCPWEDSSTSGTHFKACLELCQNVNGPAEGFLVFDGRRKGDRRTMEDALDKCRNATDVWLTYTPDNRFTGGPGRWQSHNRETAWISLPVSTASLKLQPRSEAFHHVGEIDSNASTYSGVKPMPWHAMPLVSHEDKSAMLKFSVPTPEGKIFECHDGMPLWWQECKPVTLLAELLENLDAFEVRDLTPGSGTMARAAMCLGIEYQCVCRSASHATWLAGVLDQHAAELVCTDGATMQTDKNLSMSVKEHFGPLLQQLEAKDNLEEPSSIAKGSKDSVKGKGKK